MSRPRIAIPARFSETAAVLRFRAEVNARNLIEAVYAAGGEPVSIHPSVSVSENEIDERLSFVDGVLLPGGGDISPALYGGADHEDLYGIDDVQDAFDVAVASWAQRTGRPLLAICRGLQIVNVARGGTLIPHLAEPHRHVTSRLLLGADTHLSAITGQEAMAISCYHHQAIDKLGRGLHAVAWSDDGVMEAVESDRLDPQWFLGVQWHPEDTAETDSAQKAIFAALVDAASQVAGSS